MRRTFVISGAVQVGIAIGLTCWTCFPADPTEELAVEALSKGNRSLALRQEKSADRGTKPSNVVQEDSLSWYSNKDTGDIDAVVIAVAGPNLPPSEILVREGEYGTIRFTPGGPILGLKASSIGVRGESASIDVYWMDHLMSEKARASQHIERLELGKDGAVKLPSDAARQAAGRDIVDVRLVGVKLAAR